MTAESSRLLSSPDHQSVTSLTRPGLGRDVLQVKNRDQYAGHRTEEGRGRKWRRQSTVFTAASPHSHCLTTTLMTPFPHWQSINALSVSHTGLLSRCDYDIRESQMTQTSTDVIRIITVLNMEQLLPQKEKKFVKTTCARFISQVTFPSWSLEANPARVKYEGYSGCAYSLYSSKHNDLYQSWWTIKPKFLNTV